MADSFLVWIHEYGGRILQKKIIIEFALEYQNL